MLNLAVIGTSAITEKFLAACRLTGRYCFHTVCSRHPDTGAAFAAAQGFSLFSCDLRKTAADPSLDAVYIASPNICHYVQSRLFLENGKHVLCEKPAVTNARQYDELSALARQNGVIYMEAMMSRHCVGREILHSALDSIGRVSQARIDFCQRSSRYDRMLAGEPVNIFDMSLAAGTLMDLGVYCVYAALDLFGKPERVTASAAFLPNGADCAGSAIFDYSDFIATLSYSKIGQSAIGSEIVGDRGVIKIGSVSQYAELSLVQNGVETPLLGLPERAEVMRGEADKFADYIEHTAAFQSDYQASDALAHNVHECMDLIKSDAKIKYPVKEYVI